MRTLLSAFVLLLLSGCTGIGGAAVKSDPTYKESHIVKLNYQKTFRQLKDEALKCFQGGGGWQGTTSVNAQLYSDLGEAEIQVNNGNLGTYLYIEIIKQGDDTRIDVYSAISTWDRWVKRFRPQMIEGETVFNADCD